MLVHAVKGMNDVRPQAADAFLDTRVWEYVHTVAAEVLHSFGYHHTWLPIVEETALFARGIGEETDIVSKEMYSFTDRGGRMLTLRPEGTAGAVRAYIEHNLGRTDPVQRWWYAGPMFRAERPQKGRYRQFYQIGAELFGVAGPQADAEMLMMLYRLCQRLGIVDAHVRLNSLGDDASRQRYRDALRSYLSTRRDALCESCQHRMDHNPLRVLDCKREGCRAVVQDAPDIIDVLSDDARVHFDCVQQWIGDAGIGFTRDKHLVRGLDYYTGTIFEFTSGALGSQDAILGGGRYDRLVQELGGPATPAVGFAAGVERLALLISQREGVLKGGPHLYVVPMAGAESAAFRLADGVRANNAAVWRVEVDVSGGKLKQQMRRADKLGSHAVLVLGEDELNTGHGRIKILRTGAEVPVALDAAAIAAVLGRAD